MSRPENFEEELSLEIDPSLLQAAMASVDKHIKRPQRATPSNEIEINLEGEVLEHAEPAPKVEADVEAKVEAKVESKAEIKSPGEAAWVEERRRWLGRQLEQSEKLRKMEKELIHLREESKDQLRQLEELRRVLTDRTNEFESTRLRAKKDRDEAERVAEERVVRPLLDIVDNLERAHSHAASDPAKVLAGLQMILDQFRNQLRRLGAERIQVNKGANFDPLLHEAILKMPSELPPGAIIEEVSSGFHLKGRLLRAARVVVAAGD
jgi:molecular chaperone GrpE